MEGKILEIFKSIQGEGKFAGEHHVFVRLFECNMHCVWCDTPNSIGDTTRKFKNYSVEEVVNQINEFRGACETVSITGGEPLLQSDFLKELLPQLREFGWKVYIDTNGTLPRELKSVIDWVDTIAMDIKLPSSTKQKSFWQEHEDFLNIAKRKDLFIKTVVSSDTAPDDILTAAALVARADPDLLFILQPNYFEMSNGVVKKCDEFSELVKQKLSNVRILPQMHKMLKVR